MDRRVLKEVVNRLLSDDAGQDVVEYGLLAAIFAIAAILILPPLRTRMGNAFVRMEQAVNNNWVPDDPQ